MKKRLRKRWLETDLRGLHVVDDEERGLRVGLGRAQRDDVFAGVFEQQVRLVEQLHLPEAQRSQVVKVAVEAPQLERAGRCLAFHVT